MSTNKRQIKRKKGREIEREGGRERCRKREGGRPDTHETKTMRAMMTHKEGEETGEGLSEWQVQEEIESDGREIKKKKGRVYITPNL